MVGALKDLNDTSIAALASACFLLGLNDGRVLDRPETSNELHRRLAAEAGLPLVERWKASERQAMLAIYRAGFTVALGRALRRDEVGR
jgi:hypothetical protein